jgi:hypothetical protein
MSIIKRISIVFLSYFYSLTVLGQTVIEVIPTGSLDKAAVSEIDALLYKLNGGKKGAKAKFAFIITNIYNLNDEKIIVRSDEKLIDKTRYFKTSQNFNFKSKSDLITGILDYLDEDDWNMYYSKNFNEIKDNIIHNHSESEVLIKETKKKAKKKSVKIILDNGFNEPAYSKERLENFLNSRSGNCSSLRPQFTKLKDRFQLRPEGDYYVIEFDSIGYFDSYEFELYRYIDGEKKILIKNIFHTKVKSESDDYYLIIGGKTRNAKIFLKQSYLGLNCVNNIRKENIIGKGWDSGCEDCQQTCLYQTNFNARIRGLAEGFTDDCLWSDEIKKIEFQCTTK